MTTARANMALFPDLRLPPDPAWQFEAHHLYPGLICVSVKHRSRVWSKLLIEVEEVETTVWEQAKLSLEGCSR
jgi:hypothetical protein